MRGERNRGRSLNAGLEENTRDSWYSPVVSGSIDDQLVPKTIYVKKHLTPSDRYAIQDLCRGFLL